MTPISRGFGGAAATMSIRRGSSRVSTTSGLPGPVGRADAAQPEVLSIQGAVDEARPGTWDEFTALPTENGTADMHCVMKWNKLDMRSKDVSVDTLLDRVET